MSGGRSRLRMPDFAPGTVWLVGAGPGDPGLLTLHALYALEQADVVLHDALVSDAVLDLASPGARFEPVGKRAGTPGMPQIRINARLVEFARRQLKVVRLKGGDPLVFGRGGEEALALAVAGVPFRIVPGITACLGAAAYAGVPLTHRSLVRSVTLATGRTARPDDIGRDWSALAGSDTLVLYMAAGRIAELSAALRAAGRAEGEPVALASEVTTPRQQIRRTTLAKASADARELPPGTPVIVVVGAVTALRDALAPHLDATPAVVAALPGAASTA